MLLRVLTVLFVCCASMTASAADDPLQIDPPLVQADGPPPMPAPEPPNRRPSAEGRFEMAPGTPPPPGSYQPTYGMPDQAPRSPYSPYGMLTPPEKPGPEVGLMLTESLFGSLTAAGITLLPYFLLFQSGVLMGADQTISSVIFILIFSATPLAVSQTQVSLANGSRYYFSESWPAALSGLAAQAAVLGLYYLTGWLPEPRTTLAGVPKTAGSLPVLLIGSIAVVPLIQMAVINVTKQPKFRPLAQNAKPGEGVALGLPMATPLFAESKDGIAVGLNVSLLNGTF